MTEARYTPVLRAGLFSVDINIIMLYILLMGIYTMVYFQTMFLYMRKRTFHAGVFTAVTTLYVLSVANLCLQWYVLSNGRLIEVIITVGTPDHDAWVGFDTTDVVQQFGRGSAIPFSPWAHIVNVFLVYTEFVIADALLIWRCWQVRGSELRAIFPLCILFLAELGLYIASLVREKSLSLNPNVYETVSLAVIESALTFVSAGTSLIATFLIAHRIYCYLNKTQKDIKRRYKHIIEIVIQSVVVYSVALLLLGISGTIPRLHKGVEAEQVAVSMQDYMTMLTSIIAGLAPTVMVARTITSGDEYRDLDSGSRTMQSTLKFRRTSVSAEGTVTQETWERQKNSESPC